MKIYFISITLLLFQGVPCHAQTWNALGSGANGPIGGVPIGSKGLEVLNNKLYIGGPSLINGLQVNGVSSFNGFTFDSLGSGLQGEARAFTKYNNKLYVAGLFSSAGGISNSASVASWNDTVWFSSDNNYFAQINAITSYNGELYVGGQFTQIGGINAYRIARWNGTTWSTVGTSFIGQCEIMCMAVYNGELYVGGNCGLPGGPNNNFYNLVRWNGTQWDSVGGRFGGGYVTSLCVDTINNLLYIGGGITFAGTIPVWSVAKWDGTNLSSPGGFGITSGALSMCMFNNELYVGGTSWSDTTLAKYDGVNWSPITPAPNNTVQALAVYDSNLYVGGWFTQIGTLNANYIACYGNTCPQGVGINELQVSKIKFKVYPNPAKAEININVEGGENKEYTAIIYNAVGARIAEQKFSKQTKISTSDFSKGIYQVQVCLPAGQAGDKDGEICHTEKVVIE